MFIDILRLAYHLKRREVSGSHGGCLPDVATCFLVEIDRRFRGMYCIHHRLDNGGNALLKRRYTSMTQHGVISQTAVILSNV
jgi:hypothetical protein